MYSLRHMKADSARRISRSPRPSGDLFSLFSNLNFLLLYMKNMQWFNSCQDKFLTASFSATFSKLFYNKA